MPAIGPYTSPKALGKLDGRTREAKLMRETRAELTEHVGGKPSATQRALIERAVQLTLRVATMDRKFAESGQQTEHDSRTYLSWSNGLTRTLAALGIKGPPEKRRTLEQHLADRAAAQ